MSIRNIKILYNTTAIDIPNWILFAFELGNYITEHGTKYRKSISLILSLPSDQFFSLLIAVGIADKIFSINKQMRSIKKEILNLERGSRIIYKDEKSSRKTSVISVEPSPIFEGEMILNIKDGRMVRGIPEKQWLDRVTLLDEEFREIKRTRKISDKKEIGLHNNPLLSTMYSIKQLKKVAFYPGDHFYLVGNKNQIRKYMLEEIFVYEGIKGSINDFLYLDNTNSYTNGKLFSSKLKKLEVDINDDVPVIFSDLYSYQKQAKRFSYNPQIIISSRTDNEVRILAVKEELKRKFYQEERKVVTHEFVDFLKENKIRIPTGIEFLAWR